MLTLTIQGKGVDSHGAATAPALRGPGRPPLADISLDEISEAEDPVLHKYRYFSFKRK